MITFMFESVMQAEWLTLILGLAVVTLICYLFLTRKKNLPPGPTSLPIIGNIMLLMKGDVLQTLRDLRAQYGDLYSLKLGSYNAVVVNGYETIKELLTKKGDVTSERPDIFIFSEISMGEGKKFYFKGVYPIFRPFPFAFFFMRYCSGYIKMVIYYFYNTDRCNLTLFLLVLICYEELLSIII